MMLNPKPSTLNPKPRMTKAQGPSWRFFSHISVRTLGEPRCLKGPSPTFLLGVLGAFILGLGSGAKGLRGSGA